MKRSLALSSILSSALLASVLLPASPAGAAEVWTTMPPDLTSTSQGCSGGAGTGSVDFVSGPAGTPLGSGSLQMTAGPDDFTAVGKDVPSLGSITTWSMAVRPSNLDAVLIADVQTPGGMYSLLAPAGAPTGSWTQVNALTATFQVFDVQAGQPTGETTTIPGWNSLGHGDGQASVALADAPCAFGSGMPPTTINVDAWSFGIGVQPATTYDFEAGTQLALTMSATSSTITAGRSTTLRTTATLGSDPAAGRSVDLYAKPAGASTYSLVDSAVTNSSGVASMTVSPTHNTTYQWRSGDLTSPDKTVKVRTKVTAKAADATLRPGQTLSVQGLLTPTKPGYTVTLWRTTSSGRSKLATGVDRSDGRYTITKKLTKSGTYKVYVTVPAGDGNVAGKSALVTVKVG